MGEWEEEQEGVRYPGPVCVTAGYWMTAAEPKRSSRISHTPPGKRQTPASDWGVALAGTAVEVLAVTGVSQGTVNAPNLSNPPPVTSNKNVPSFQNLYPPWIILVSNAV